MFQCCSLTSSHPLPPGCVRSLFSTSASLFLPCKKVHHCNCYRFHIYALTDNICFSDFTLWLFIFIHLTRTDSNSLLFMLSFQSCQTLQPDGLLPGSSAHRILQTRILEWVAISFSRGSSWPRDWTWVSCIKGRFFTIGATWEALRKGNQNTSAGCKHIRQGHCLCEAPGLFPQTMWEVGGPYQLRDKFQF